MRQVLVKKGRGLFQCWHLEKKSSKIPLKVSVQVEVYISIEKESRTKRPGGGAVDVQPVSFPVPIWVPMASVLELAVRLNSCVWRLVLARAEKIRLLLRFKLLNCKVY